MAHHRHTHPIIIMSVHTVPRHMRMTFLLFLTPPGASAGRKSPKTFLTVDPRGRPYAKRHQKTLCPYKRVEFTVRCWCFSIQAAYSASRIMGVHRFLEI